jgi:hypothetical protein
VAGWEEEEEEVLLLPAMASNASKGLCDILRVATLIF